MKAYVYVDGKWIDSVLQAARVVAEQWLIDDEAAYRKFALDYVDKRVRSPIRRFFNGPTSAEVYLADSARVDKVKAAYQKSERFSYKARFSRGARKRKVREFLEDLKPNPAGAYVSMGDRYEGDTLVVQAQDRMRVRRNQAQILVSLLVSRCCDQDKDPVITSTLFDLDIQGCNLEDVITEARKERWELAHSSFCSAWRGHMHTFSKSSPHTA